MKYKVSIFAMMIAMSASGSAWSAGFPVDAEFTTSKYVAVDANGLPVSTVFADPTTGSIDPSCTDCKWVDANTLTPAGQAALVALGGTAAETSLNLTGAKYDNHVTGKSLHINDGDVVTNGDVSAKTLHADGVDVGGALADHGTRIGDLEASKADTSYVDGKNAAQDAVIFTKASQTDLDTTNGRVGGLEDKTQTLSRDPSGVTVNDNLRVTGASVFDNAVTINTAGHTTTIDGSGATFANATGNTKIDGGDVTSTGTTRTGSLTVDHDANVGGSVNVTGYVASSTAYVGTFAGSAMTGGSNEIGNALTSYGAALADHGGRIDALEGWQAVAKSQISDLQNQTKKANEGVAIALAAQNFTLETGKRFGVSANMGTFEGNTALATSLAVRLDTNWQLNGSVGFGTNNGTVGARAGVIGQW